MLWHEHLYAQNIIMVQLPPFQIAPRAQAQLTHRRAHRGHIFNGFLRGRSDERQFLKKKRKPVCRLILAQRSLGLQSRQNASQVQAQSIACRMPNFVTRRACR